MDNDPVKQQGIDRRGFLKVVGATLIAPLANKLAGQALEPSLNKELDLPNNTFGWFIDKDYPANDWVNANMVLSAKMLDGLAIGPNQSFSLLDTLIPDPQILQNDNSNPQLGYVSGISLPSLQKVLASGICKVATDLFRASLISPVEIEQSVTHNEMSYDHPYFKTMPIGTDASVYLDPENNIKYDLVLRNPLNFPIKINYKLFNARAEPSNHTELSKIEIQNYAVSFWASLKAGMREVELPVSNYSLLPEALAIKKLTSAVSFEPIGHKLNDADWQSDYSVSGEGEQYKIQRILTINGKTTRFERLSNYYKLHGKKN